MKTCFASWFFEISDFFMERPKHRCKVAQGYSAAPARHSSNGTLFLCLWMRMQVVSAENTEELWSVSDQEASSKFIRKNAIAIVNYLSQT